MSDTYNNEYIPSSPMYNAGYEDGRKSAKAEIERLTAERDAAVEAWKGCATRSLVDEIEQLTAERDSWEKAYDLMVAARDALDVEKDAWQGRYYAAAGERDALKAQIEAAEKQEPVGWIDDDIEVIEQVRNCHYKVRSRYHLEKGTKLFTHPAPAVPEGWQPIETAPKTRRTILLGYVNSHGNWRTMRGKWFSQEEINETWEEPEDCDGLEGWYETSVEVDDVPNCWETEPTHWMPLPAAPKLEDEK